MSADLIEYLVEYCVSRGRKSMRYIETVALAWTRDGVTTVEMARDASSRFSKDYYTILKAMGISGRNPVENEISYIDTWRKTYGFDLELIQEACSRTVLSTGQPSFQYADKILSGWKKKKRTIRWKMSGFWMPNTRNVSLRKQFPVRSSLRLSPRAITASITFTSVIMILQNMRNVF